MNIKDPYAVKQLVDAAGQLHAARLYARFSDSDCFLMKIPKLDEPALVVLMGNGGQTFGLNLFMGPDAVASYRVLYESGGAPSRRALQEMRMVGYQMSDAYDLTYDAKRWLKKAKVKPAGNKLYPDPMSLEPGKVPRVMLKDSETKVMLSAVRGILSACEDKAFTPNGIAPDGRVLCVTLHDTRDRPDVTIDWQRVAQPVGPASRDSRSGTEAEPVRARFDLSGLANSGDNWLVTLMPAPGVVEGDNRQPFMLVMCSEQSNCFHSALLMGTEPNDIVESLAKMMLGDGGGLDPKAKAQGLVMTPPPKGLPARLVFDGGSLRDVVAPAFEPLGVMCIDGSSLPGMRMMLDELEEAFDDLFDSFDEEDDELLLADMEDIPADDNLREWKRVDGWLKDMIYEGFEHDDRYWGTRAMTRYFGTHAEVEKLLKKYRQSMIIDSYAMWFALDYRSARKRPTLAEHWLDDRKLPASIKCLIRSIVAHAPGLYRVEEADEDTGKITLADLFTGEIEIATDFALSTCLEPGHVLSGRLVPVGAFHFFYAGGPLISRNEIIEVFDYLRPDAQNPSTEFFREQPHLLGRLWDVLDMHRDRPLHLRNSDGHDLVFHEATMFCLDRDALERMLAKQPNWHPDGESPDDWVWLRAGQNIPAVKEPDTKMFETHAQGPGGMATMLAQLEINGNHLTLHANSRDRLDLALETLMRIEGIKVESIQTHAPGDPARTDSNTSNTSDQPIALEPEEIEAMRDYLTNYYRQWLDQPIPALNNRTPRQAATQPNLRIRLAAMIRAMPDPADMGSAGITLNAPRQMLLSELGLENEPSH